MLILVNNDVVGFSKINRYSIVVSFNQLREVVFGSQCCLIKWFGGWNCLEIGIITIKVDGLDVFVPDGCL